ncbi:hypothetical protein [Helicobacter cetorum]|uniref:hypothetical protein n=1 Tax=Helicobacter cetorum TaxID=138563 RepID=UPI000CF0D5D7|nr:hypothetical protein [Helicobacter cetorum]
MSAILVAKKILRLLGLKKTENFLRAWRYSIVEAHTKLMMTDEKSWQYQREHELSYYQASTPPPPFYKGWALNLGIV